MIPPVIHQGQVIASGTSDALRETTPVQRSNLRGLARLRLGPTRHERDRRLGPWEHGHLARMDNRGPAAHCGRDARAPKCASHQIWLNRKDGGASRSPT